MKKQTNNGKYPIFLQVLSISGLPSPVQEHKFHPERKWRFDYAYPDKKVAIEIDGGTWNNGAHVRPIHYQSDCEKFNEAAILGWRVLKFIPQELNSMKTVDKIKKALDYEHSNEFKEQMELL